METLPLKDAFFFTSVLQGFAVAVHCYTMALAVRTASCRTILVHPSHVPMDRVCQITKGTSATAPHKLLETGETHTAQFLKSHMHIMSLVKAMRSLTNLHENEHFISFMNPCPHRLHVICVFGIWVNNLKTLLIVLIHILLQSKSISHGVRISINRCPSVCQPLCASKH